MEGMEQWTTAAELAKAVELQTSNIRLANCVGLEVAGRVASLAREASDQLGPHSTLESQQKVGVVCRLAIEALLLVDAVDPELATQMSICFEEANLLVWGFSPELAETICFCLAALVYALAARRHEHIDACFEFPVELEQVGCKLDGIALHMYGALCRLSVDTDKGFDGNEMRLVKAFQTMAAWSLALVCSCLPSGKLTSEELWEWTNGDATLAFVMVKGIMNLDPQLSGLPAPSNLSDLRVAVIEACLGCASTMVAFKEELDADLLADDIDAGFPMPHRLVGLSQHRARIAVAVSDCDFLDVILREFQTTGSRSWLSAFVAFVSVLVQPPLDDDSAWAEVIEVEMSLGQGLSGILTQSDVRGISDAIVAEVSGRIDAIWDLILLVPQTCHRLGGGAGFLRDCASLAYSVPISNECCRRFVDVCFAGRNESEIEATSMAMLCMLAVNCALAPAHLDSLTRVLASLQNDLKTRIIGSFPRARVPIRYFEIFILWKQLLGSTEIPTSAPDHQIAIATSEERPPKPVVNLERCAGKGGLRALLHDAPEELSCALDGKLLVDPVRSPYGHIFERSNLVSALTASCGRCPITGQTLAVEDCPRDAGLRIQALQWVRKAKAIHQQAVRE